jgi:hypothetical protein
MSVRDDRWPGWARPQLQDAIALAVDLAATTVPGRTLATELYDRWFAGTVAADRPPAQPLVGQYRRVHAGVATVLADGVPVLDLRDKIGSDGWWRTWNTSWRPQHEHPRVLLSPSVSTAVDLVATLTARLRDIPYVLAMPGDPSRFARSGAAGLYLSRLSALTPQLVDELAGLLRADSPPLCLPLTPGVAVAQYPDNGMSFGEHRCHLLALALGGSRRSLADIGKVFAAHGVDPSMPYRS